MSSIWSDTSYGVSANAYQTTSNVESYLESPLIDLTSVEGAKLAFTHGINYFASVATAKEQATLEVRVKNGSWVAVEIPTYPASLGNSTANAEVSLNDYVGNIIQFRFKYLATSTSPGRWQIKNLSVVEVTPPAHVITVNSEDSPLTVELNGDATKTTKLTVASNYSWNISSTTGSPANFTYVKDSETQITITPAADNTTGAKKEGIGSMTLSDGTVTFTINFDQANKSSTPSGPTVGTVLYAETFGTSDNQTNGTVFSSYDGAGSSTYNSASTLSYTCKSNNTKIQTDTQGACNPANLLIGGKNGGSGEWAKISGIKSYGATSVTVTWASNGAVADISIEESSSDAVRSAAGDSNTATFALSGSETTITLVITASSKSNTRVDSFEITIAN